MPSRTDLSVDQITAHASRKDGIAKMADVFRRLYLTFAAMLATLIVIPALGLPVPGAVALLILVSLSLFPIALCAYVVSVFGLALYTGWKMLRRR